MEEPRNSMPFRTKLVLMMVSIVAVILVIVALYFQQSVNRELQDNMVTSASQQAKIIGGNASQAIINSNDALANQIIRQYAEVLSVQEAAILLSDSSLLGYYAKLQDVPLSVMDTSLALVETETELIITEPVNFNDKSIGFIYVRYDKSALFDSPTNFISFLMIVAIVSVLIAFLFAGFFQKILTSPIRKLEKDLEKINQSKNNDMRLNEDSNDDVGKLALGFNKILDRLQRNKNDLSMQGNQLKKLVEVRTKQLFQSSHYDTLTDLPNRYLLVDRLRQAITKSSRQNTNIALLFLDLDRFKVINDNFGHQNGDQLLKEVAKRLRDIARKSDTVARLGGDEFVFLLENLDDTKDAARTALRIIECLNKPFKLQEHTLHMSTSIGISIYPDDGTDDKTLLKNADISMYYAKKKGPGSYAYYSRKMNNTSLERLAIEGNLRNALQNNELHLLYQPQLRLKDDRYRNVEALIRWNNPELGNVSPGVFIPISEETGLIKQIDLWVISQACKQIKQWNDEGLNDLTVAINVSAGHLISSTFLEHLKTEIIVNQIKAEQIEIEITEEVFVEQTERTIKNLKAIKKLGAKIAIDDFGTGYSSLQYIQDFPADTLKLDGMFIQKLETDKASQGIVRSTIILAHSLGLELVAECVEDEWQLDFLRENECDLIQGFYLYKPLTPEQIPEVYNKL